MMGDTGIGEGVPRLEHVAGPITSLTNTRGPIIHMTELNLTSTPDPAIGLYLCDFITKALWSL